MEVHFTDIPRPNAVPYHVIISESPRGGGVCDYLKADTAVFWLAPMLTAVSWHLTTFCRMSNTKKNPNEDCHLTHPPVQTEAGPFCLEVPFEHVTSDSALHRCSGLSI